MGSELSSATAHLHLRTHTVQKHFCPASLFSNTPLKKQVEDRHDLKAKAFQMATSSSSLMMLRDQENEKLWAKPGMAKLQEVRLSHTRTASYGHSEDRPSLHTGSQTVLQDQLDSLK